MKDFRKKKQRFAIRKLNVGVVSLAIGALLVGVNQIEASAQEITSETRNGEVTVLDNSEAAEEGQAVAENPEISPQTSHETESNQPLNNDQPSMETDSLAASADDEPVSSQEPKQNPNGVETHEVESVATERQKLQAEQYIPYYQGVSGRPGATIIVPNTGDKLPEGTTYGYGGSGAYYFKMIPGTDTEDGKFLVRIPDGSKPGVSMELMIVVIFPDGSRTAPLGLFEPDSVRPIDGIPPNPGVTPIVTTTEGDSAEGKPGEMVPIKDENKRVIGPGVRILTEEAENETGMTIIETPEGPKLIIPQDKKVGTYEVPVVIDTPVDLDNPNGPVIKEITSITVTVTEPDPPAETEVQPEPESDLEQKPEQDPQPEVEAPPAEQEAQIEAESQAEPDSQPEQKPEQDPQPEAEAPPAEQEAQIEAESQAEPDSQPEQKLEQDPQAEADTQPGALLDSDVKLNQDGEAITGLESELESEAQPDAEAKPDSKSESASTANSDTKEIARSASKFASKTEVGPQVGIKT